MMRSKLQQAVRDELRDAALISQSPWEPSEMLVAAVSGGPDSAALVHALVAGEICPPEQIIVAHLDHSLRDSSADEAAFVAEFANSLGTRAVIERVDAHAVAVEQNMTVEEAGRLLRYAFFAKVAQQEGARFVITGHTANDQAETVLMNLLRGAGPAGLRGMRPVSQLPGKDDILLVRPLLRISRDEVEAYCAFHGLETIHDHSNLDTSYFRNWVRLELLPLVEERSPGLADRLNQTAEIIAADYELLANVLDDTWTLIAKDQGLGWLRLDLDLWRVLPLSLKRSTLKRAASILRGSSADIGFRTVENAREIAESGQVGSSSTLPDGLILRVGYRELVIASPGAELPILDYPQLPSNARLILPIPGEIPLGGGWRLKSRLISKVDINIVATNPDQTRAFVNLAGIEELMVRPAAENERFQPLGMEGHSALVHDVMVNRKIPLGVRPLWPVVATADHLVWLVGHQIDHRVRLESSAKSAVLLSLEKTGDGIAPPSHFF